MIGPEHERLQGADDVFSAHLWDADGGRFLAVRVTGGAEAPKAEALLMTDESGREAGPALLETEVPLERWRLSVDTRSGALACELRALSGPVPVMSGQRYTQLCAVTGSIEGFAVRSHEWGDATAQPRRRFVSAAVPGGEFVSVAAVRPAAGVHHGDELITGHVVEPGAAGEPHPLEDVRLSTIYDAEGRPRTAGLELYRPGDEFPARAGGHAVWSSPSISFFRWSVSGHPPWGTYEIEQTT